MTTRRARAGRRATASVAAALSLVVVTGCVADPPPPTVVGEERSDDEDVGRSTEGALLALDRVEEGFNPHLLSDQGVDTDLVASLLLPSAFVPGPDGPELNRALLDSAEPLPDAPDTVRYTIDPRAQWSDGVPVAAEDFEYLWQQMTTQPGVVDPAAYDRIENVRAGAGGKVVDVEFDALPDRWQTLFSHLLPGHILKDAPEGFLGAMARLPVMSAGPFMVRTADVGRGELEFVRNDRYWADAPELDQLVVRRATGAGQLGATLRSGPGSASLVSATPRASDVADTVPGVASRDVGGALQLELGFNTVAPTMSEAAIRRAVSAAVGPEVVGRIVTGESAPSVTGFPFPAEPPGGAVDQPAVERELAAAGYHRVEGRWERDGTPLSVTLGVQEEDPRAATAAYTVADQLRAAGVGARVWELDAVALYADALPHGLVDAVVGWQRVDGDPGVAAASRFACAAEDTAPGAGAPTARRPPTTVPSLTPPEPDTGTTTTPRTPETTTSSATTSTPPRTIGTAAPARTSGVYGVCDAELDGAIDRALEDGDGSRASLAEAGGLVADLALRVPLVRPSYLLSSDSLETGTVVGPGSAEDTVADVFDNAPTWRRTE